MVLWGLRGAGLGGQGEELSFYSKSREKPRGSSRPGQEERDDGGLALGGRGGEGNGRIPDVAGF